MWVLCVQYADSKAAAHKNKAACTGASLKLTHF